MQIDLGKKHDGTFTADVVGHLIEQGQRWCDAGALQVVIEARESAPGIGCFDDNGKFKAETADRLANAFGLAIFMFEAPTRPS